MAFAAKTQGQERADYREMLARNYWVVSAAGRLVVPGT